MTFGFVKHIIQCWMLWFTPADGDETHNPWFKGSYLKTKRILKQ